MFISISSTIFFKSKNFAISYKLLVYLHRFVSWGDDVQFVKYKNFYFIIEIITENCIYGGFYPLRRHTTAVNIC